MGILKYNECSYINVSINNWTCIADGVDVDIGIVLRVSRDIFLAYTPDTDTVPGDVYVKLTSGNIFITTENQAIWIRVPNPNFPATLIGEIIEPEPILQPSTVPVTIMGLPWRLG